MYITNLSLFLGIINFQHIYDRLHLIPYLDWWQHQKVVVHSGIVGIDFHVPVTVLSYNCFWTLLLFNSEVAIVKHST